MLRENISRFRRVAQRDGLRVALAKALTYGARKTQAAVQGKRDVIGFYGFILGEEQGYGMKITPQNVPERSMTWLIPDFQASSGGHINIVRMMDLLRTRGFPNQHVVIVEPHRWANAAEAQEAFSKAFSVEGITVSIGVKSIEPCHFLVATGWQTAYWVAKYRDTLERLYFVQDFEPYFYAQGSEYAFAENTYRLGLTGITAGTWLAEKLAADYGMKTFAFSFGCDSEFYRPMGRRDNPTKHIFFYARPVTPRRSFEMGLLALDRVCKARPDAAVIFAGWDVSEYAIPFPHLNAGTVAVEQLPDLYSQCDVALVLSATNLSLLPLEVAACGCPMVINDTPNANWLLSRDEALYCDMSVEAIADAINRLLDDEALRASLAKAGMKRAKVATWEAEGDKVAGYLATLGT
ncbi:MAG: glycosyltransferase family 4 protein [Pseudomonadota bacterium]